MRCCAMLSLAQRRTQFKCKKLKQFSHDQICKNPIVRSFCRQPFARRKASVPYIIRPFHRCNADEARRRARLEHILQKLLRFVQLTFVAVVALEHRLEQHVALDFLFVGAQLIGFDQLFRSLQVRLLRLLEFRGGVFGIFSVFWCVRRRRLFVAAMPWIRRCIRRHRWSTGRRRVFALFAFHRLRCHPSADYRLSWVRCSLHLHVYCSL